MTRLITRRTALITSAAAAGVLAAPALVRAQATHEIQMLNVHPDDRSQRNVFLPRLLTVAPGDTITFVATDRGHNSASIDGMVPEGGTEWTGKINEEVTVTLETPGFYGYQCTPHAALGMVGLLIVEGDGMMDNMEAARGVQHRGPGARVWDDIWAEVDEMELG